MRVSQKDRKKYAIKSTTNGFPQLELALHKAAETIGWKALTCHLVVWCNEHQPPDRVYSLAYWQKEMQSLLENVEKK